MQEQPDNEDRSQHPSRGQYTTEEWMLICQHNIDVQPVSDPQENYDWTISSQSYSNLGEVPSFISSRRGSTIQSTATHNVDARLLLGKQLHVYNIVYQHFHSNNPNQLKLIVWHSRNRKIISHKLPESSSAQQTSCVCTYWCCIFQYSGIHFA